MHSGPREEAALYLSQCPMTGACVLSQTPEDKKRKCHTLDAVGLFLCSHCLKGCNSKVRLYVPAIQVSYAAKPVFKKAAHYK